MGQPVLTGPEGEALFDAYLEHCHAMFNEAQAWAAAAPASLQSLLGNSLVPRVSLDILPPMPAWMNEHLTDHHISMRVDRLGSELEYVLWAYFRFFNVHYRNRALITADQVACIREQQRAFFAGAGRLDWSSDADPAARRLEVPGLADLLSSSAGAKPTRRWQTDADAAIASAGAAVVARNARNWLAALGDAEAHRAATPDWHGIATLHLLIAEMEKMLPERVDWSWNQWESASRRRFDPEAVVERQTGEGTASETDSATLAYRAALRQFDRLGDPPYEVCGLNLREWLPGDPRRLSTANGNRARGAAWLLARAAGSDAVAPLAAAADSLAVKVYHSPARVFLAPRSVVGAKACLEALAAIDAPEARAALAELTSRFDYPPLCKVLAQAGQPEARQDR